MVTVFEDLQVESYERLGAGGSGDRCSVVQSERSLLML